MRSVLTVLAVAGSLSACIPPPGSVSRPGRIQPVRSQVVVHTPTEIKVFDEFTLDKRTLCRSRSGLGSEAQFRGAAALVGHDVFPEPGCPDDHVFHYFETGLRFGSLTSTIFPADITIHRATLRSKLKESYTRKEGFTKGWSAVLDECGAVLVNPLLQDLRTAPAGGASAGPRGTWVGYFPRTTSPGEVTFADVTEAVRNIYFRRSPNFGFVLTHERPPAPRFTREVQGCVSLFESFELRVTFSAN
jgi:hypothetical protein